MRLPPFIQLFSILHSSHFIHKVNYKTIANCHDLEKRDTSVCVSKWLLIKSCDDRLHFLNDESTTAAVFYIFNHADEDVIFFFRVKCK